MTRGDAKVISLPNTSKYEKNSIADIYPDLFG